MNNQKSLCARLTILGITGIEGGFPHSEIRGSKVVRTSPRLIAAYHVLHRLSAPRHPPDTLIALDRSHYRCPSHARPSAEANTLGPTRPHERAKPDSIQRPVSLRTHPGTAVRQRPLLAMLAARRMNKPESQSTRVATTGYVPSSQCRISAQNRSR